MAIKANIKCFKEFLKAFLHNLNHLNQNLKMSLVLRQWCYILSIYTKGWQDPCSPLKEEFDTYIFWKLDVSHLWNCLAKKKSGWVGGGLCPLKI